MGELLDRAAAGERILVERDRRPVAVLVPYEDAHRLEREPDGTRERALAALNRLESFARRMAAAHPEIADLPAAAEVVRQERDSGHGVAG
jgi:prevent-host-death family protein